MPRECQEQGREPRHDVRCLLITVGDDHGSILEAVSREAADRLVAHGHAVKAIRHVREEIEAVRDAVDAGVGDPEVGALLVVGGIGPCRSDVTPDALEPMLTRHLPGFGELFRQLSYAAVGPQAILSRVLAGVIHRTLVFALPAASRECGMAIDQIIAPVLAHAVSLLDPPAPPSAVPPPAALP